MPLYRFYRIVSSEGPEEYIGSTIKTLYQRFHGHKTDHKRDNGTASSILFTKYGVETCSIILISEQEMEKIDARREERRLIEASPMVVNKIRPIAEKEEQKEEQKERSRKYYEGHHEEMKERSRKHYEEHREEVKEHHRIYYAEHCEAINAYQTEKIPCDICGKLSIRGHMTRHKRTKSCVPPQQ